LPAPGNPLPHKHTKGKIVWVREVVCRGTQTYTLTVVV